MEGGKDYSTREGGRGSRRRLLRRCMAKTKAQKREHGNGGGVMIVGKLICREGSLLFDAGVQF